EDPQIAFDGSGNAIAIWPQHDGRVFNIWANRFDGGTSSWGSAEEIETDDSGYAERSQIAFDGSGNAIAVWQQEIGGGVTSIWANKFNGGTSSWGSPEKIETDDSGYAGLPQIAFDGSGNAIAVWPQYDGSFINLWANIFDGGTSSWGTAEMIKTNNSLGASSGTPRIAFDDSGNAIAIWSQWDSSGYNIWENRFDRSTSSWGTAEKIETDDPDHLSAPKIAFDESGNAIAVWQQDDGSIDNIWVNRFDGSTSSWGTAEMIETDDSGNADFPQIAVDGSGNAIAVWQQWDGSADSIWANRFE
ncbi:MAG: hypothetical protein GY768_24675, partial [Planctomycetaceae bacterium]|nr:hypothetical protein [Planctomycetaceae bacterium]